MQKQLFSLENQRQELLNSKITDYIPAYFINIFL